MKKGMLKVKLRTCHADKSCARRGQGRHIKVGRVTPLWINYGAKQTSRLGDHYREIVRIARHRRCRPARERGIGFCDVKIRVRGGEPVIRKLVRGTGRDRMKWNDTERRIHVVLHLSDNLTTARLSSFSLSLARAPFLGPLALLARAV